MSQNGKGDKRRPLKITQKEFENNWDKVFKKKNKEFEKEQKENESS